MRHFAAAAMVALAVAVVLVLVLAEDEAGEDTATVTVTQTGTEPPQTETAPAPPGDETESEDVEQVERAVALYVEAAETGEVRAPGLPTTDELSIQDVQVEGDRATVKLAGGTRLSLRRKGDRWRVERVRLGRVAPPSPPSNGP